MVQPVHGGHQRSAVCPLIPYCKLGLLMRWKGLKGLQVPSHGLYAVYSYSIG
jgi:hypothetical protein